MPALSSYIDRARKHPKTVVFPEGEDLRILRAAARLERERIAQPLLLGEPDAIQKAADELGILPPPIIASETSPELTRYAELYLQARPKTSSQAALRFLKKPLNYAGMMVKSGDADAVVAGVANPTARVVKAGLMTIGLAEGMTTPSSFFLMVFKEKAFVFADCALNVEPSAEQLADIALASAQSAVRLLDEPPKVAMLSFSTLGSAQHAQADKVIAATRLAKARSPDLAIEGELQFDAAISPAVAANKAPTARAVAGQANVFIFPDLNSGNIAYKLAQYLAAAQAIGPFLQGFAKPISDLSRAASVEDIVMTTAVLLATA